MYILYLVSGMVILSMRSDQISPQSETYDWSLVVDYKRHILIIYQWCKCPGEWGKNVRENLFVLYAVLNYIRSGGEEPCDMGVYDIIKCLDSLWKQESMNELWDAGCKNDKLHIIALVNQSACITLSHIWETYRQKGKLKLKLAPWNQVPTD